LTGSVRHEGKNPEDTNVHVLMFSGEIARSKAYDSSMIFIWVLELRRAG
jgi:hypothetical protein